MTAAIHVDVTAGDLARFEDLEAIGSWCGPVAAAIARATGQVVDIDWDRAGGVATIGQSDWTLVLDLPEPANDLLTYRWERGGQGAPLAFDIAVPDWIVALVARSATTSEQAEAVLATEAERHHERLLNGEAPA